MSTENTNSFLSKSCCRWLCATSFYSFNCLFHFGFERSSISRYGYLVRVQMEKSKRKIFENWNHFVSVFIFFSRVPYNYKTLLGLILTVIFISASAFCILFCVVPSTCFFIGSGWLFISFAKNMRNDLSLLNIAASSKRRRHKLKKHLCQTIHIHSNVKELSNAINYSI